tara:strand:+ start:794 stop:928 length:135 start_codon:yes stop_codon:yes gene_type:complete
VLHLPLEHGMEDTIHMHTEEARSGITIEPSDGLEQMSAVSPIQM